MTNPFKLRNILFDLDGTLTDPQEGITKCIQYALKKMGRPSPHKSDLLFCIGPPLIESFKILLGSDRHLAEKAVVFYRERFSTVGKFENRVYDHIQSTLVTLYNQGYQLYVATAKPTIYAKQIMDHFDLAKYFLEVYGSELDGTFIDKTISIRRIIQNEQLVAQESIMVGDRSFDIMGAHKNKLKSIGVSYGFGLKNKLNEPIELTRANPTFIADNPKDILKIIRSLNHNSTF